MVLGHDPALTRLLNGFFAGDQEDRDEIANLVYEELHRIAGAALAGPGRHPTLEPTGLVHEAWIRLSDRGGIFEHRRAFFAFAARIMHSVLVDHARARGALKRGGDRGRITIAGDSARGAELDFVELHEALARLQAQDPELHDLVELRFFSGLGHAEIAELLGVSLSTVERRWRLARAWLRGELGA
jgi:RNA polymerase sigma factor (TIGR02999 family)